MPARQITAATAGTWMLGDLPVNRIGFGTKRLAGNDALDATARERAIGLLRRAVDLGVNHLDTAAFYPSVARTGPTATSFTSLGWANEIIRTALAPYPRDLVIVTKVGPTEHGLARPDELRGLVEADLRALGRDHLDVVNLRQNGLESIAEHVGALAELRQAGLVRHVGLSNVRPHLLAEAQRIVPVVCVQNRYGVDFGRVNDDMLRTCREQGIAFVPFFSLTGAGRETGGVTDNPAVLDVARRYAVTPAQVRLAWTLSRGPHVLAIPGTGNPDHLADNVAAGTLQLTPDDLLALE